MAARRKAKIIIALTALPSGWVLAPSVSAQWHSWQCSQNLRGPFLRAILQTKVEASASGGLTQNCSWPGWRRYFWSTL